LQIERRLAPFWKGLDDHSHAWTDNQLIAIARGLPLPPAEQTSPGDLSKSASGQTSTPRSSDPNINHLAVPIENRPPSLNSEGSSLSPSQAGFSLPAASSPFGSPPSTSPFFRGRAKTLAALTTSRNNSTQSDMTPQELQLPKDPYVSGRPLEAVLYHDASECPICFLYYPPYLNKTRCCDQPICSECFVQIKRPDPHPPEHHDDPDNPHPPEAAESGPHDEYMLVSEPATCPFCKQPEFGITYESPPFKKGLTYSDQHRLASVASAMSSSSSVNSHNQSNGTRRRTTSLGANSPNVITTDRIRPDWAKKLSDARAHALRRAAAATALHNAAYVLGNNTGEIGPRLTFGRRRRTLFGADGPSNGAEGLGFGQVGALLAAAERHGAAGTRPTEGQSDLFPGRHSSRRSRIDDLEDLMMMEAIRLSLAAEEERKKKDDKEAAKNAKKEEKQKAKEAKKAEKAMRKGSVGHMYSPGMNTSSASQFTTGESSTAASGKGKAPDRSGMAGGFNPLTEPTSTINAGKSSPTAPKDEAQRHLENSRASIQTPSTTGDSTLRPQTEQSSHRLALRQLSNVSSSASSFVDENGGASSFEPSPNASGLNIGGISDASPSTETPPGGGAGTEPMFNFRSLAAVIGHEDKDANGNLVEHIEHAPPHPSLLGSVSSNGDPSPPESSQNMHSSSYSNNSIPAARTDRPLSTGERLFGVSRTNGTSTPTGSGMMDSQASTIGPSDSTLLMPPDGEPLKQQESNPYDMKHYGDISVLDSGHFGVQQQQQRSSP
jgi:hypothetical protein